ncbi:hypothetical protein AB0L75_28180 [Streptomyces sp. NPDC052101]|uniref:hypothetical protein n=1 Tax=Streptomyces sp. NPDC052101 TaxID=3155763 RepID=UPI0034330B07
MTTLEILTQQQARRTITVLSLPGLIRFISEIDDNGPVSRGSLGATFDDLTRHQLRHALETADGIGLVSTREQVPVRYRLTRSGKDLADVYDAAARWARAHQFPSTTSDFVTRVQHTLKLLAQNTTAEGDSRRTGDPRPLPASAVGLDTEAARALRQAHSALAEWLRAHPRTVRTTVSRSSHGASETERAT